MQGRADDAEAVGRDFTGHNFAVALTGSFPPSEARTTPGQSMGRLSASAVQEALVFPGVQIEEPVTIVTSQEWFRTVQKVIAEETALRKVRSPAGLRELFPSLPDRT